MSTIKVKSIIKSFFIFLKDIIQNRNIIFTLVKNDFKQQYAISHLNILWAFIQPVAMICIMWFVFQVGFRAQPVSDVPFILWLSCGMIPWFFFAESLSQGTNSIIGNAYLVKKIVFRVSILPLVKIIAAFYIHIFFILFLMVMFLIYGFSPTIYWLQLPFYIVCTFVLVLGMSWFCASINVFYRDVSHIVALVLQFGFWLTPIFWGIDRVPKSYQWLIQINPMNYIVQGYRNTFIDQIWFWQTYKLTPYFAVITAILLVLGVLVFKKLRPHFADVL